MNKECIYPDCMNCPLPDCKMDDKEIKQMLKDRKSKKRITFQEFRDGLPKCNECEHCTRIEQSAPGTYVRVCTLNMRIVSNQIVRSPGWCRLRTLELQEDAI